MPSAHAVRSIAFMLLAAPALAACSTMSAALFPEKPSAPAAPGAVPQSGTSFFAPVPVAPGTPTGTPQGARIGELRNRLIALHGEVSARNANLSEIRQKASGEGALYRLAKTELQLQSPPSGAKLAEAQAALDRFAQATFALDGEMKAFAKGAADANRLMTDAAAVRDGGEDDERQLNTLRGEIAQTANQLDRLVNDLSTEWALQSAFLAKERAALASLGAGATAVAPTAGQAQPAPQALLQQPVFVTIRFDRANMAYREALAQAVSTAKRRKPDSAFDVVAVSAGRTVAADATARGAEVVGVMTSLGVEAAKLRLFNAVAPTLQSHEVRIYVR